MDIKHLLEQAKYLLERDKSLQPVLFVETDKELNIVGLVGNFNGANKRKMMIDIGIKFAKEGGVNRKIISLSMVSEADISKVDIINEKIEKFEAIVIATLDVINNRREILTQEFIRNVNGDNDDNVDIKFKDSHYGLDDPEVYLLDAFMQGYNRQVKRKEHENAACN